MSRECVFCRIVKGEIPCYKIYDDEEAAAFLDAFPVMKGQVLVIPKKHLAPWLFDLDDNIYTKLMLITKKIAKAVDKAMKPTKTGLMVEGFEVDHVHIKIFPLSNLGFKKYPAVLDPVPSEKEMKEIAEKIRSFL